MRHRSNWLSSLNILPVAHEKSLYESADRTSDSLSSRSEVLAQVGVYRCRRLIVSLCLKHLTLSHNLVGSESLFPLVFLLCKTIIAFRLLISHDKVVVCHISAIDIYNRLIYIHRLSVGNVIRVECHYSPRLGDNHSFITLRRFHLCHRANHLSERLLTAWFGREIHLPTHLLGEYHCITALHHGVSSCMLCIFPLGIYVHILHNNL